MRNPAESLIITMIQSDLVWEDRKANLERFEEKIRGHNNKMEVVVLPEMFSTGFSMKPSLHAETMNGESVQWMKRVAAENNIIITGSLIISENGDYFIGNIRVIVIAIPCHILQSGLYRFGHSLHIVRYHDRKCVF